MYAHVQTCTHAYIHIIHTDRQADKHTYVHASIQVSV